MKNTLFALLLWGSFCCSPTAYPCASKLVERPPERVVLWQGTIPALRFNRKLMRLRAGDTVVFGDGTEFTLGAKEYGNPDEDYGISFQMQEGVALWIPFLTDNPTSVRAFLRERQQLVSYGTDFQKLSRKLGEYEIPRRKIRVAGYECQYFLIDAMPANAFSLMDFLNPKKLKELHPRTRAQVEKELFAFAKRAAPFRQIGLDDGTRNLYYAPGWGWFLREFTGYNEMFEARDSSTPVPFIFSGDFRRGFSLTIEGFAAAESERLARSYPGKASIFNPDAGRIFLELEKVIRAARRSLYGAKNGVSWDRPTEFGRLLEGDG